MTQAEEESAPIHLLLANDRLQRLLTFGQEINALRSKISIATDYIRSASTTDDTGKVVLARESLRRDLERDFDEAKELLPIVDELVSNFEEQLKSIKERRRVHEGLAKIESLSGKGRRHSEPEAAAIKDREQISELESLIGTLDDLEKDLSLRREVVLCPRCSSHAISYQIAPTETGFSLYRCNECGNAWRIRRFSMRIGSPAQ